MLGKTLQRLKSLKL